MMFHTSITKMTFSFFTCSDPVEGVRFLEADMNVICGSDHYHAILLFIAAPALLLYVIGIPATAFGLLYSERATLQTSPGTREKLGFLYSNYEPEYFYWESLVVMRLVFFAAISVLFADLPDAQASLGMMVLFFSVVTHLMTQPYLEDMLDKVGRSPRVKRKQSRSASARNQTHRNLAKRSKAQGS